MAAPDHGAGNGDASQLEHSHVDGQHPHDHSHGHGHHHHVDPRMLAQDARSRRMIGWALVVAAVFLLVEIVGGLLTNSLALLSDAAHMATDCAAYAIALVAARMAMRPANERRTFGYARAEILAALVNGATLIAASAWIVVEATRRMFDPEPVSGAGVMGVAAAGLAANMLVVVLLLRADRQNLNVRGALLHGVTDAVSSVAVLVAGAVVLLTGFDRADALASYLISALVVWGSWRLVREAVEVLLNAAPRGLDADRIASALLESDGVLEVHDVHVWSISTADPAMSAHVRAAPIVEDRDLLLSQLQGMLRERFGITHTTLQLTVDRGSRPLDMVGQMRLAEAVEWATDHVAATHPELARSVILAAAGVAAMGHTPEERISPVALSLRTLRILRGGTSTESHEAPDDRS